MLLFLDVKKLHTKRHDFEQFTGFVVDDNSYLEEKR